jgi:hypothetical protein
MNLLCELRVFDVTLLSLGLAQALLVKINQQHVFHVVASVLKSNRNARRIRQSMA